MESTSAEVVQQIAVVIAAIGSVIGSVIGLVKLFLNYLKERADANEATVVNLAKETNTTVKNHLHDTTAAMESMKDQARILTQSMDKFTESSEKQTRAIYQLLGRLGGPQPPDAP